MKNILKVFAASLAVLALFSCQDKAEYYQYDYACFDEASYTVLESTFALTVPVHVYAPISKDCAVTYKVVDGTAKKDVNYTVSGNGVLNFTPGVTIQNININFIDHPGEFSGNITFQIVLESATNDVEIGGVNVCEITIGDNDHPLTAIFGEWGFQCVYPTSSGFGYNNPIAVKFSEYEDNPLRVWISDVVPFTVMYAEYCGKHQVYGEVAEDLSTISIPVPQGIGCTAYDAFGIDEEYTLYLYDGIKAEGSFSTAKGYIVFKRQDDGSYITEDAYGLSTPKYVDDGVFYYYMNALSKFNPAYPTIFAR